MFLLTTIGTAKNPANTILSNYINSFCAAIDSLKLTPRLIIVKASKLRSTWPKTDCWLLESVTDKRMNTPSKISQYSFKYCQNDKLVWSDYFLYLLYNGCSKNKISRNDKISKWDSDGG